MKGLLNIKIAVDYDELLKDETILGIQQFTGIENKEKLATFHLSALGDKLTKIVNSTPQAVISITGDLIEDAQFQPEEVVDEEEYEELTPMDDINTPVEVEVEAVEPVPVVLDESSVADFENNLMDIASDKGNPLSIKVDRAMDNLIKSYGNSDNWETSNGEITKYMGFSYRVEAMDELYAIEYKDYVDNETKHLYK